MTRYENLRHRSLTVAVLIASALTARAEVRLPKLLSSHMVVQRDRPIHLWGWADVNETVTAALNGASESATADRLGQWSLYLPPQPAGGPFEIRISGTNQIVLSDVLSGDVWFASGQSNMEMPLSGWPGAPLKDSAQEIANANHPKIRLLLVEQKASGYPLRDLEGAASWSVCAPESATKFSAAAYFFGRELESHEHVPIGLIDSTWGGTPAEAWISLPGISSDASLMPVFSAWATMAEEQADMSAVQVAEKREDAEARSKNQPLPKHAWRPEFASWDPAWLFNGMIAPFLNLPIKGVIWYQGESNAGPERAAMYGKVFPALINDWHARWQQGDFPFLFVQIANYNTDPGDNWPAIREAQRRTLSLANTGMAVTADIGNPGNIHPADKQDVGRRLALAARAIGYHEDVEYSGPMFRSTSTEGETLRVWFDHTGTGLQAKGGALTDFQIAGEDRKFVDAAAKIDGSSVVVSSPQVAAPKYVRYGWQNNPALHLYNSAELPASPFTSEMPNELGK